MLRINRWLTIVLLTALILGAGQPIRSLSPPALAQTAAPQPLTLLGHIGGPTLTLAIQGQYAYVGFNAEFAIFDLADPAQPRRISYLPLAVADLAVRGDYAYVVGRDGLQVIAIADPRQPTIVAALATADSVKIALYEEVAYLIDDYGRLQVIDMRRPEQPQRWKMVTLPTLIQGITVDDAYAYLATSRRRLCPNAHQPVGAARFPLCRGCGRRQCLSRDG